MKDPDEARLRAQAKAKAIAWRQTIVADDGIAKKKKKKRKKKKRVSR